jgi:hypothetical protein
VSLLAATFRLLFCRKAYRRSPCTHETTIPSIVSDYKPNISDKYAGEAIRFVSMCSADRKTLQLERQPRPLVKPARPAPFSIPLRVLWYQYGSSNGFRIPIGADCAPYIRVLLFASCAPAGGRMHICLVFFLLSGRRKDARREREGTGRRRGGFRCRDRSCGSGHRLTSQGHDLPAPTYAIQNLTAAKNLNYLLILGQLLNFQNIQKLKT